MKVIERDDVVDSYFRKVTGNLIKCLRYNNMDADACVDTLMLAKYLEKMADHAVNIADWAIYRETGNHAVE